MESVFTGEFGSLGSPSYSRYGQLQGLTILPVLAQPTIFDFYTKSDKPAKTVIRHLPVDTSFEDIVALQGFGV
jgi:hypothetical protein